MLTESLTESEATDSRVGNMPPTENPPSEKTQRVKYMTRKLFADSTTRKNLIVLITCSIFAFLIAADTGLFRGIEEWERNNGLSNYHLEEFAILLMVLGIAITIFIYRRYEQIREGSLAETMSIRDLSPAEIWAGLQYEELKNLFQQVETAKKEWQLSMDSMKDMVILSNLDGTIHRCNRAFRDFIGLPYEEILRGNIASLLARFGIELEGLDLKALNARFHISGKWFGVRSYPYTDYETANITRVVIIMLEVSGRRVAEEKVQFVWGNSVYSRLDGGKERPSHPESQLDISNTPTDVHDTSTKATN